MMTKSAVHSLKGTDTVRFVYIKPVRKYFLGPKITLWLKARYPGDSVKVVVDRP
jgi:hypothetical protein